MSSMEKSFPVQWIDAGILRKAFNGFKFDEKIQSGEITTQILKDNHPSKIRANEPFCTRSQMISYINQDGIQVALVHQYLRKDGTIGASGRPDPKKLLVDGVLYIDDEFQG